MERWFWVWHFAQVHRFVIVCSGLWQNYSSGHMIHLPSPPIKSGACQIHEYKKSFSLEYRYGLYGLVALKYIEVDQPEWIFFGIGFVGNYGASEIANALPNGNRSRTLNLYCIFTIYKYQYNIIRYYVDIIPSHSLLLLTFL